VRGWPASLSGATFHSSPILMDVNNDGEDEIMLVSYDGNVIVFTYVPYRVVHHV